MLLQLQKSRHLLRKSELNRSMRSLCGRYLRKRGKERGVNVEINVGRVLHQILEKKFTKKLKLKSVIVEEY
jgi:DNA-binding transcriptional regulator LsrR (DeoR family)